MAATATLTFDDSFARAVPELALAWTAAPVPSPRLVVLNEALASELGLDPTWLRSAAGIRMLVGTELPDGVAPVALAYAGHQFGSYSPRLGDGRALLLGELVGDAGERRDLHLKGSGRTPFARGGDGKAALGPMLREYLIGEAMHALGVPTTRALAVTTTGDLVAREGMLPGAVLARAAASHLRVGTFEYAARHPDPTVLTRLADYAISRHHPAAADAAQPALALLEAVVDAQAELLARWMLVGFIHGVMNTDNMTISGETIDYGPCAFMDHYHPNTVFSSIDHAGRYAYANQPAIAHWNLTRFAETLLRAIDDSVEAAVAPATEALNRFSERFRHHWKAGMRAKLGLADEHETDDALFEATLDLLHGERVDMTSFYRALAGAVVGDDAPARALVAGGTAFDDWARRWRQRRAADSRPADDVAAAMRRANPVYIPRNHLVEEALAAASEAGDLDPFERLLAVVRNPFVERPGSEQYAAPAPPEYSRCYQTFCGT